MLCSRESDEQGGGYFELQIASHLRARNIRRHEAFDNDGRSRRSRRRCLKRLKSSLSWSNRGLSRNHQIQPDSVSKRAIKRLQKAYGFYDFLNGLVFVDDWVERVGRPSLRGFLGRSF